MSQSVAAIATDIGARLKQARLNADLTQATVAEKANLSIKLVQAAEKGRAQLETLIAYLQALDMLDNLDMFIPKVKISPIQLAKLQGEKRQRASGKSTADDEKDTPTW